MGIKKNKHWKATKISDLVTGDIFRWSDPDPYDSGLSGVLFALTAYFRAIDVKNCHANIYLAKSRKYKSKSGRAYISFYYIDDLGHITKDSYPASTVVQVLR